MTAIHPEPVAITTLPYCANVNCEHDATHLATFHYGGVGATIPVCSRCAEAFTRATILPGVSVSMISNIGKLREAREEMEDDGCPRPLIFR